MRERYDAGFTLVELMIVVAIVTLLSVLAAPRVKAAADSSRQAKVAHDLKAIHDALERHYLEQGYYPVRLNKLKEDGFLKAAVSFRVPLSNYFYFYAVDDNRTDESPRAYILAAPGKDAGTDFKLFHDRPLPKGKRTDQKARAWLHADMSIANSTLWLYKEDDQAILDPLVDPIPGWLGLYRTACRQPTAAVPCDVYTN